MSRDICAAAVASVAFAGATVLALKRRDGWGWLIFAGILAAGALQ
jgi:hypothetical protein